MALENPALANNAALKEAKASAQRTYTAEELRAMYEQPSAAEPSYDPPVTPSVPRENALSYDDVIAKTAVTLGLVIVSAAIGWFVPSLMLPGMLIGLVLAAAAIVVTGRIDPARLSEGQAVPAFLPILLPLAVLVLPLLDMILAVVRRVSQGKSPFHPDRMHLHHRLLALGHTHRRAVVLMYLWTAVFAFGAASLITFTVAQAAVGLGVGALVALALTLGPLRPQRSRPGALTTAVEEKHVV